MEPRFAARREPSLSGSRVLLPAEIDCGGSPHPVASHRTYTYEAALTSKALDLQRGPFFVGAAAQRIDELRFAVVR